MTRRSRTECVVVVAQGRERERDVFVHIGVLLEEMADGLYLTVQGVSGRI